MRMFSVLVDRSVKLHQPRIPDARLMQVNPPVTRRLDEGLRDVFNQACMDDDVEAAAELLGMMEKWHARRSYDDDQLRRADSTQLSRMRGELERRYVMKGVRPAAVSRQREVTTAS